MPFVYSYASKLDGKAKVGSKQCVALIQHYSPTVGQTSQWKEGEPVLGNLTIEPGTAIATFVKGKYASLSTGNHAAFFLEHAVDGFYVVDQWSNDDTKPRISKRLIRTKGRKQLDDGRWPESSNNAYAYAIIER